MHDASRGHLVDSTLRISGHDSEVTVIATLGEGDAFAPHVQRRFVMIR